MNRTPRPAAVLICVLVVLLLVGMLSMQATQTMLIIRRGDEQRQRLQQARELLELGRRTVQRQMAGEDSVAEEMTWELELPEGVGRIQVTWDDATAGQQADERPGKYRIVATYPATSDKAVVVSWNSNELVRE